MQVSVPLEVSSSVTGLPQCYPAAPSAVPHLLTQGFLGMNRGAPIPPLFLSPFSSHHHHFRYHLTCQDCPAPLPLQIPSCLMASSSGSPLASWGLRLVTLLSASVTTSQSQYRKLYHMPLCKGWYCPSPCPCTCAVFCPRRPHRVAGVYYHPGLCVVTHIGTVSAPGICGPCCRPMR